MNERWYVGTQSWSYRQWNGVFYDEATRSSETLVQYAVHLFVELPSSGEVSTLEYSMATRVIFPRAVVTEIVLSPEVVLVRM